MNLANKLLNYNSKYSAEVKAKKKMLEFLDKYLNPFNRNLQEKHFTASAFLLNSNQTKFLLIYHKKLNKLVQPGGHADDGESNLLTVAIREAQEESGIKEIKAMSTEIFDIDIHYIPAQFNEPAHQHYDVRFLLKTVNNDNFILNKEANELQWLPLPPYSNDLILETSIRRMIEKYLTL